MLPRCPGKLLAIHLEARSHQHNSGLRKVPWGQDRGDRGHHRKSHFAEGSAWDTTAGVTAREQPDWDMGCMSPPSKSPLSSEVPSILLSVPLRGWEGFVAVFHAGLLAECFAGQETLQRGQGGVRNVPLGSCLALRGKELTAGQSDHPAGGLWCPGLQSPVCTRQTTTPGLPASPDKPRHTEPGWAVI